MRTETSASLLAGPAGTDRDLADLRAGQVSRLYSQVHLALYGLLIGGVILALALWKIVPRERLMAWFIAFLAVQSGQHFLVLAYRKASQHPEQVVRWGRRYAMLSACMAMLWGIAGVFLFPSESFVHQCLMALFLVGLAAGAGLCLDSVIECYLPFILLVLVPPSLRFLFEGTEIHFVIGILGMLYTFVLIAIVTSSHNAITESLRLRIEKDKLISSLQESREQLESRVAERTANLREKNEQLQKEILDHQRTEEALHDSEERYRLLAQNSLTGIYIIQYDQFVYVNDRLAEILFYNPEEMLGKPYWEFLHSHDVNRVPQNGQATSLGQGWPTQYEFRVVCRNGETKYLEAFVSVIKYRGEHAIMGNVADITSRRITEELLKASEERYRTLFEKAGDGICILETGVDHVPRILSANRAAAEMHGHSLSEFLNLNVSDLHGPQDAQVISGLVVRLMQGEWIKEEILHRKKDGSDFPLEVSAGVLQFSDQKYILAMYRDITHRKEAEQSLRKHKETLEALLNATTDVAILLDSKGTILALNQEAASRLGSPGEQLVGRCIFHYGPLPLVAQRKMRFEKVVSTGAPWREVDVGLDGRIYDTSASPVFGPDGMVEGMALFARDITDDRKAEEGLRKSEEKYRKILETIADGYHEVDLAGNFTLVNDSMCGILGRSREELLGMNLAEVMDEVNARNVFHAYNDVYKTGVANRDFTYQVVREDGAKRDVSVSISLMRGLDREPCGFRGILRDETERNLLEDQLRQAVKMEAIGRMAGGVAHDFNNLLTAIMGYSDILARQMTQGSPQYGKIQQISRASLRGAELTRQLLAFSRTQILDMRVVDFAELIRDIEDMLRRLIGEDVELTTAFVPDLGCVKADPAQIGQIIMNLVVNARDAMPKGGKLTIEAINAVLDEQYARTHAEVKPGRYVMLSVSDTGQGMDTETQARAFDPFFTTKDKEFGTGLGLSTVYGIVKQHGGHVAIYTELGRGTTFKVFFPLVEETCEKDCSKADTLSRVGGTEIILLVEDEETVRNLACEALEMLGYVVLKAGCAEDALSISKDHYGPIDLLLTDVVLPRMDGKSLFGALEPARPEMRVLYVSGYTENFIVHHGVLDPGVNFLQKPFSVDALAQRVRDVLAQDPNSRMAP